MKFGTPTPKCSECTQVPVTKTGDVCPRCDQVLKNRAEFNHDQEVGRLILKYLAIIAILGAAIMIGATIGSTVTQR